jgi:hypothetical protein
MGASPVKRRLRPAPPKPEGRKNYQTKKRRTTKRGPTRRRIATERAGTTESTAGERRVQLLWRV